MQHSAFGGEVILEFNENHSGGIDVHGILFSFEVEFLAQIKNLPVAEQHW